MQDRICRIDENLLHRTAGPYIWIRLGSSRAKHNESAYPQAADVSRDSTEGPSRASRRRELLMKLGG